MQKYANKGEYLVPQVEVMDILSQCLICESVSVDTGNPFGSNTENPW